MSDQPVSSSHLKNSSLASPPPAIPDARTARNNQGQFNREFRLSAVGYAASCGKSQRAAALDMGVSDKTLSGWISEARPDTAGNIDVQRFDELAQLRTQNRQRLEQNASPPNGTL